MIRYSFLFVTMLILFSCTHHQQQNVVPLVKDSANKDISRNNDSMPFQDTAFLKFYKDSVIIPSFEIEVSLSVKAEARLKAGKETVIVNASFTGLPKDTTSKYYAEWGEIPVASRDVELRDGRIAKFEGIKFSKSLYDSLADKDIQLLINIYSGRKSTKDNLLDCDIFQDKISTIKGRRVTLKGKLIYGDI